MFRSDEVIVWQLSLALSPEGFAQCQAVLSAEERQRAQRLLPKVRRRYIACWGQVRWLLGRCLEVSPASLDFIRGPWGKPYLLEPEGLAFNLSHSQDLMLLAVGWNRALGIDIEVVRPLANLERLAKRCLAPLEWNAWQELPERERLRAFFRFWTLKEALAKAYGCGLALGIQRLAFALEASGASLIAVPKVCDPTTGWAVHELALGEGICAALCARPGNFQVIAQKLPADWISAPLIPLRVERIGRSDDSQAG